MFSSISFAGIHDGGDGDGEGIRTTEQMDSHSPDPYNLGRYVRLVPVVIYHNGDATLPGDGTAIALEKSTWLWGTQFTGKKYGVEDSESDVNVLTETFLLINNGDLNIAPTKDGIHKLTIPTEGNLEANRSTDDDTTGYPTVMANGPIPLQEQFHQQKAGVNQEIINEYDLANSFQKTTPNTYGEQYFRLVGQGDKPMSAIYTNFAFEQEDMQKISDKTYAISNQQTPYYDKWEPVFENGKVINREEAFAPNKSFYRGSKWSSKLGIDNDNRGTLQVPGQLVTIMENVDLVAAILGEYKDLEPGTTANVKVKVTNYSQFPVEGTNLRWCENDDNYNWQSIAEDLDLQPMETKEFTVSVPVKETPYNITVKVNQEENAPAIETNYENNVATTSIVPMAQEQEIPEPETPTPPATTGDLKLEAESQTGTVRAGGTAKWTDYVTATLTAQRPPVPSASSIRLKGSGSDRVKPSSVSIRDYHISTAVLSVPKKHPDFTFGNPIELEPMEYEGLDMPTGDKTSVLTFQEDWSMAGANIYSMLQKRLMAEHPKYYSIKADYTVRYQVEWTEQRRVCDAEGHCTWKDNGTYTEWRTIDYDASANLLVNGTGVDSRAQ